MAIQVASEGLIQPECFHLQTSNVSYSPSTRLEGKVAIVTGGAGGIGEAIVRLFVSNGAKVVVADVVDSFGITLPNSIAPALVTYVHCDVSVENDVEKLVSTTMSRYGKVDIFFNNAGILGQQKRKSIMDFDGDEFDDIMKVNVKGVALGIKHAAKVMLPRRTGCIISTVSVAGVLGGCGPHSYTASKHAIVGITKNVAAELGTYGIRVNCISPFGVATNMLVNAWYGGDEDESRYDMTREQKVEKTEEFVRGIANLKGATLRAQDVAEAALYLASDESRYISGHNLVIDGGFTTSKNCIGL